MPVSESDMQELSKAEQAAQYQPRPRNAASDTAIDWADAIRSLERQQEAHEAAVKAVEAAQTRLVRESLALGEARATEARARMALNRKLDGVP
jgi:hypothetical protein